MFGSRKPEVMVVGAGPVGLFGSVSLARKGVKMRIIDEGWRHAAHSYALALHPSSLSLLKQVGLPQKVFDSVYPITRVGIYDDSERRASFDYAALDADFNYLGVLPQSRLEDALEALLQTHGVHVEWNHRLARLGEESEDHVDLVVDRMAMESMGYAVANAEWIVASSHTFKARFVIGADGHGSMVRRALGINFEDAGPTRYFAVFEFKTDLDLQNELRIVLGKNTTSVLWPLPDGYCRWSFELTDFAAPPATRDKDRFLIQRLELPELTDENLGYLIESRAPWFTGSVDKLEWRTVVRFEQRLATLFGRGRSWLVGDAAHMALPVAVQSMNVGLAESAELSEIVADVLHEKADAANLSGFGVRSLSRWRRLLGLEGEKLTCAPDTPPWVRTHARRIAAAIPASGEDRRQLLKQAGLSVEPPRRLAHSN